MTVRAGDTGAVAAPPIAVTSLNDGRRTVLVVRGEVDLLTVGRVQRAVDAALRAGRPLTLDLAGVGFIDSTGLRLLLESRVRAPRATGAPLGLVLGEARAVRRLLELAGVLALFDAA